MTKGELTDVENQIKSIKSGEIISEKADRAIELVRNTCQALKIAIDLLEEVEWAHRDNNNPDYNQCDGDPCEFCRVTRALMHSHAE